MITVECSSDSECQDSDMCYNGACVSPCILEAACAINAECYGENHRPKCRCPKETIGNPYEKCQATDCVVNSDCNEDSVCIKGVCLNACSPEGGNPCAYNANCFARNHAASCKCPPALPQGDPLSHCERTIVLSEPECRMDGDCPSGYACLKDECRDACKELEPCATGARCTVSDSVPFRTMICRCPEGYIIDENGACKTTQLPPLSCSSDKDCSDQESCINRICRNPCNCGENADCFIRDHRPVCSCREGYDGNPYRQCRIVGCRTNLECESQEACVNGNCISPCLLNSTCGPNAECLVEKSQVYCRCRSGFEGDAYIGCIAVECRSNGDCPQDKQCRSHRCINPCQLGDICGNNAECLVRNHLSVCKCKPGFTGSPYIECSLQKTAECYVDADCPHRLACLAAKCVNPCTVLQPCSKPAQCEVSPTLPVRTMICSCPPGYISSGRGACKPATPILEVACEIDHNCNSNHACITSVCKNPCQCGPNTDCQIRDHKPVCACRSGFVGDPRTGCYDITCQSDDQCADEEMCINKHCIPACKVEPNICGQFAECYGFEHRASCRCAIGTFGNPTLACTPISCRANSECPPLKSCINSKCVEPCTANICDAPAECRVHLHELYCVCPPGYQSTSAGCNKTETICNTDFDCPPSAACLSNKCVNPCLEISPCGINAECTVVDTPLVKTMICECIPGFRGNALTECTTFKRKYTFFKKYSFCNSLKSCIYKSNYLFTAPITKCVQGQGTDENGECMPCLEHEGRVVDARGRCICNSERGFTARGDICVPAGCRADNECEESSRCVNAKCVLACEAEPCGLHATCEGVAHRSRCTCITGYFGNPRIHCNATSTSNMTYRTDFPLPEMQVLTYFLL